MRRTLVIAALFLVGCDKGTPVSDIAQGDVTTASVVMPDGVASVTITPATASIAVGATVQLSAVAKDKTGATLTGLTTTWASGNESIATVSASGLVTGKANGRVGIKARIGERAAEAAITVGTPTTTTPKPETPKPAVASVSVTPASVTLLAGGTATLTASAKDAAGAAFTTCRFEWSTSNKAVAQVSAAGVIVAVNAGTATITAACGGKTATAAVTVTPRPVATVTITPATLNLVVGRGETLKAVAKDDRGEALRERVITWTSSNPTVATVDAAGRVLSVAAGTATITATSEGKSGTALVTVAARPTTVK